MAWKETKKQAKLYHIKCCPNCGSEDLYQYSTGIIGPRWSCQNCCVGFEIRNPSYLTRRNKEDIDRSSVSNY